MNLKKAFTLTELLLVLAIIGIVSALGMTTMKIQTDRAYNMYYRQGYISLYNALSDAIANDYYAGNDIYNYVSYLFSNENSEDDLGLGYEGDESEISTNVPAKPDTFSKTKNIKVKNGIKYSFNYNDDVNDICDLMKIDMTVPQRKTKANNTGEKTVSFYYLPHVQGGLLIPEEGNIMLDRKDLLPCYIDNGIVGRRDPKNSHALYDANQKITIESYKQAFCSAKLYREKDDNEKTVMDLGYISCGAIVANKEGIIKFKKLKNNN